ncbi:MAG: hypothetical protein ACLT98_01200 [Eggerthellaceae bacterium]
MMLAACAPNAKSGGRPLSNSVIGNVSKVDGGDTDATRGAMHAALPRKTRRATIAHAVNQDAVRIRF